MGNFIGKVLVAIFIVLSLCLSPGILVGFTALLAYIGVMAYIDDRKMGRAWTKTDWLQCVPVTSMIAIAAVITIAR